VALLAVTAVAARGLDDGWGDRMHAAALVERFADAWADRDVAALYELIDPTSRSGLSPERFRELHRDADATATTERVDVGAPVSHGDVHDVPVTVHTRMFGELRATLRVRTTGDGEATRVRWSPEMTFPGLRAGETVSRTTRMPPRADLLDRDGRVIVSGPARRPTDGPYADAARAVAGWLGPAHPDDRPALERLGVPSDVHVGAGGLERLLDEALTGRPGGVLRAGDRVLAKADPVAAGPVRSAVSLPLIQTMRAAQSTAPSTHGAVALNARTGEVLAFDGVAWSALQPPGSVMKIVTVAAALEHGVTRRSARYASTTRAAGIENADGARCGGTLTVAFARSCNSVFAPMAQRLGAERLVRAAERFGFNRPLGVAGSAVSSVPWPNGPGELAQTGIGQARTTATPLQVALVTATIANDGRRPTPTFLRRTDPADAVRVVSPTVARQVRRLMVAAVADGTGGAAGVPGLTVAGKTGTAELRATQGVACEPPAVSGAGAPALGACGNRDGRSTTAWMTAFADAADGTPGDPIVVTVMRAENHQGGRTAAPVAAAVLAAAHADADAPVDTAPPRAEPGARPAR